MALLGRVRRGPIVRIAGAAVVLTGAAAGGLALQGGASAPGIAGLRTFPRPRATHVESDVDYPQRPPIGGPHWADWQTCGFYTSAVSSEAAVHSLEHGAVWITYRRDAAPDDIDLLRQLSAETPYVLVSAFQTQRTPIVASAWARQLALRSARDRRLAAFLLAFRGGPQTPELGASCEDGLH